MKLTRKQQKILLIAAVVLLGMLIILGIVWMIRSGSRKRQTLESSTPVSSIAETQPKKQEAQDTTDYQAPSYPVVPLDVPPVVPEEADLRIEAESADFTGQLAVEDVYPGYSGEGYLTGFSKSEGDKVEAVFSVPSSQHYDVTISVCADSPVTNAVALNGESIGEFQIEEPGSFVKVTFSGVYIPEGEATLSIQEIDGYFALDYFEISSYREMYEIDYQDEYPLSDPKASDGAKQLMAYLSENYGKKIISGQYAAGDADTEPELIYRLTGKYPAIRFGDVEGYTTNSVANGGDVIAACERWAERGGIVGLMWHWDAPSGVSSVYAAQTDFSLMDALPPFTVTNEIVEQETDPQTDPAVPEETAATEFPAETEAPTVVQRFIFSVDVALKTPEELDKLVQDGTIPEGCRALLTDIDSVAETLKPLAEKDIPVLWRPLHEASGDWFWWGAGGAEAYRWLWDVMYRRMTEYHELHNLIWIWNGQSETYLVDQYDIAGLDIYLDKDKPFGSRYEQFVSLNRMTGGEKMLALSECSTVPDRNLMFRDNTIWSFFGIWYGEYLIDEEGRYSEAYTKADDMIAAYNSEVVITLDDTKKVFAKAE